MDCAKRSAGAGGGLPDDALVEILWRLPAKFLCRSKCVSQAWCDLITDRLCCKKLPQTLEGFFYGAVKTHDGRRSTSSDEPLYDCITEDDFVSVESNEAGNSYWFINLLGRVLPLIDSSFSFLRKQPRIGIITLIDSCNGLLLFGHIRDSDIYDTPGYIVCNPATEHWVNVPTSGFTSRALEINLDEDSDDDAWETRVDTYLIFDPVVSSHFQLIEFCHNLEGAALHTYSSETGVWGDRSSERKRWKKGGKWDLHKTITSMRGTTVVNNMLHLIVSPSRSGPELIAMIDGKGKTRRTICWLENRGFPVFLGQSKGLLYCMSVNGSPDGNSCHMTELSIWVLEDYGVETWKLKQTVSFSELFGKMRCQFATDYNVVTIHPDRDLVFFVQHWDYKLISYDMDRREVCVLSNVGCDCVLLLIFPTAQSHRCSQRRTATAASSDLIF